MISFAVYAKCSKCGFRGWFFSFFFVTFTTTPKSLLFIISLTYIFSRKFAVSALRSPIMLLQIVSRPLTSFLTPYMSKYVCDTLVRYYICRYYDVLLCHTYRCADLRHSRITIAAVLLLLYPIYLHVTGYRIRIKSSRVYMTCASIVQRARGYK